MDIILKMHSENLFIIWIVKPFISFIYVGEQTKAHRWEPAWSMDDEAQHEDEEDWVSSPGDEDQHGDEEIDADTDLATGKNSLSET